MQALILDGTLVDRPMTTAVHMALTEILDSLGWQSQSLVLREEKIAYCLGCFECWTKTPGRCRIEDDGQRVAAAIIQSDLVVYLTPITFGGYSSTLKKAIDRTICLISPFFTRIGSEVHHRARYPQYPMLLGIGLLPQPDPAQAAVFAQLVARNAINYHAPAQAAVVFDATQDLNTMREQLRVTVVEQLVMSRAFADGPLGAAHAPAATTEQTRVIA